MFDRLNNLRLGVRLGLSFGILILLSAGVICIGLLSLSRVGELNRQTIEKDWTKAQAANAINAMTRANARATLEILMTSDQQQKARIKATIAANKKHIDNELATLDRLVVLPEGRKLLSTLRTERAKYVGSFTRVLDLVDAGQLEEAKALINRETLPTLDALQMPVSALSDLQRDIVTANSEQVSRQISQTELALLLIGTLSTLAAALLGWWITGSITKPMQQAVRIARDVAAGRLSPHRSQGGSDECGQLLQALHDMNLNLIEIISRVRQGADALATATRQIAAGNLDLSSRTEEQASALEQTAASLHELTTTVRQNHTNALAASEHSNSTSDVAGHAGQAVRKVVGTMASIDASSHRIVEIITLIDSIAFQTNILALNAAVEAARAGEQGRGFAVVAGEVRTLAGRSAMAAKEIRGLIGEAVEQVAEGGSLVKSAGQTMEKVVTQVREVATVVGKISVASSEQATGIEQINQAVGQMDQVTQQNAALVEEMAAATENLKHQADDLVSAVSAFQIQD